MRVYSLGFWLELKVLGYHIATIIDMGRVSVLIGYLFYFFCHLVIVAIVVTFFFKRFISEVAGLALIFVEELIVRPVHYRIRSLLLQL